MPKINKVVIKLESPFYRAYHGKKVVAEKSSKRPNSLRHFVRELSSQVNTIDWDKSNVRNPYMYSNYLNFNES